MTDDDLQLIEKLIAKYTARLFLEIAEERQPGFHYIDEQRRKQAYARILSGNFDDNVQRP